MLKLDERRMAIGPSTIVEFKEMSSTLLRMERRCTHCPGIFSPPPPILIDFNPQFPEISVTIRW
jgi:hypothetical protein